MPLWAYRTAVSLPSWTEFNSLRSVAMDKVARLLIYWQDAACHLVIAERQVVLVQLHKYHYHRGEQQASLKAV